MGAGGRRSSTTLRAGETGEDQSPDTREPT
jgi:hypothetical protein